MNFRTPRFIRHALVVVSILICESLVAVAVAQGQGNEPSDSEMEVLDEAIELDPENGPSYARRADARMKREEYAQAASDYTKAIDLGAEGAHYGRARAHAFLGERDLAIADYTAALKNHPKDVRALYQRGTVYLKNEELAKAVADYTAAIELGEDRAWYGRGRAHSLLGEYDLAIADFTSALKADPKEFRAPYERGTAYLRRSSSIEPSQITPRRSNCRPT